VSQAARFFQAIRFGGENNRLASRPGSLETAHDRVGFKPGLSFRLAFAMGTDPSSQSCSLNSSNSFICHLLSAICHSDYYS